MATIPFDYNIYRGIILRISSLASDDSEKDVTFTFVDSDVEIKAHKCILVAVSHVFKTMFSGNFAEENKVEITDISPKVFQLLISGIYLNDILSQVTDKIPVVVYADLYYAAEKYDIEDIRAISKKFMIEDCHKGNTHFLLTKAKLFNLSDLETTCKEFFQEKTYNVLESHIRFNLNDDSLSELFNLETLTIETEYDLYMALEAMVDNKVLPSYAKCLAKIRFLTMDSKDVVTCNLLDAEDKVAIISNIEAVKHCEVPAFSLPSHLSAETKSRNLLSSNKIDRKRFWTSIMVKSLK